MSICHKCKNKLARTAKFCDRCGTEVELEIAAATKEESRNPIVAAVLNFFMPGAGYLYASKRITAGIMLLAYFGVVFILDEYGSVPPIMHAPVSFVYVYVAGIGGYHLSALPALVIGFVFAYDVFKQAK